MPTSKRVNKEHLAAIEQLQQQARKVREAHADYLLDLKENHKAELAEARRLHALALAHEKTVGASLKNLYRAATGGE